MESCERPDLHEQLDSWLLEELKKRTGRTQRNEEPFSRGLSKDGKWIAGIEGKFFFETCYIDLLATDPAWRGRGLASRLLSDVETECRRRGIPRIFLTTQDYQALPFYLKHGFSIEGELKDIPFAGTTRYCLVRTLPEPEGPVVAE